MDIIEGNRDTYVKIAVAVIQGIKKGLSRRSKTKDNKILPRGVRI